MSTPVNTVTQPKVTPPKLTPSGLSALMCARICHDLVSPIGALGTALEVLDDDGNKDMHEDALDLVRMSARQASSKLQYLRLAFGASGSAPGILSTEVLKANVDGMFGEGKADIVWDEDLGGLEKGCARLLLNLVMLAVQAIPRGGVLTIRLRKNTEHIHISLRSEGPKSRLDENVKLTLQGGAPEDGFDGRTIQPFYTGMIVRELKGTLETHVDDAFVSFDAIVPIEVL